MIEKYTHHGVTVSVFSHLKGKHRDHCLCFRCLHFKPGTEENCLIAKDTYKNCVKHNLVTPVFECPKFTHVEVRSESTTA
jgi:hypothetical protein